jgi:glycosyltransferase involved in cell wall biosynthesis
MNVAFVATYDSRDVHAWSGIPFSMARALEGQGVNVEHLGPLRARFDFALKVKTFAYRKLRGWNYDRTREPVVARGYARQVEAKLRAIDADIVLSPGVTAIAELRCAQPIAFWADATFDGMIDFYPTWTRLAPEALRKGHAQEQMALDRCALAMYCSDWAAQSALKHYHVDPSKVKVVPFGANLERVPDAGAALAGAEARPREQCALLWLGVDWERKGGDVALAVARHLNASGLPTELTIVGVDPPAGTELPPYVKTLGFISKRTAEGRAQFDRLLGEAHFLILPTRAEAYGIVFCEANAFATPCLASDVGGIPTIIRDGVNGQKFPLDAPAEAYARFVRDQFADWPAYRALCRASLHEYQTRLNWDVAGRTVKALFEDVLAKPSGFARR